VKRYTIAIESLFNVEASTEQEALAIIEQQFVDGEISKECLEFKPVATADLNPNHNTPEDIPDGFVDVEETSLTLPDLPGDWEYGNASKSRLLFGRNSGSVGGYFGEIDTYVSDGENKWDLHIRPIVDNGTESGTPRGEPSTVETFDTLHEAIETLPEHIGTYYE
jgi:hypothetical protein